MTSKQRAYLKSTCHDNGTDLADWQIQSDAGIYPVRKAKPWKQEN